MKFVSLRNMLLDSKIHPLYRAASAIFPFALAGCINLIFITFVGTAWSIFFPSSVASRCWTAAVVFCVAPLYAMTLLCLYVASTTDPGSVPPAQAHLWRGLAREFARRQWRGVGAAAGAPGGAGGAGAVAAGAADGGESERARLAGGVGGGGGDVAAAAVPTADTVKLFEIPERLFTRPGPHDPRWCRRSGVVKPPRAHYCSTCDRLVLKMDHHCPWVANCVGYANYKAFCLLLGYGWAATALVATWWLPLAAGWWAPLPGGGGASDAFLFSRLGAPDFMGLVLCLAFLGTLTLFGGTHAWLVAKGRTTLEAQLVNDGAYDFGAARNCALVFGARMRGWLWPAVTADVDAATRGGVDFSRAVGEATRVRAEEYPLPEEAAEGAV
jgi:hypothetical protein